MPDTPISNFLSPPSTPPREVSAKARRRSWNEPAVRLWWTGALILLGITLYFVGDNLIQTLRDYSLVRNGVKVKANITAVTVAGGEKLSVQKKLYGPELNPIFSMEFTYNGKTYKIESRLKAQRAALGPGPAIPATTRPEKPDPMLDRSNIDLFIDPANPLHWTDRTELRWLEDVLIAFVTLPLIFAAAAMAIFKRSRMLNVWRAGESAIAEVIDTRHSPAAPFSRMVKLVLRDSSDQRTFTVAIPTRIGSPQPGDEIVVVFPEKKPTRAIVAALYG